jgi:hypothetical protein
VLDILNILGKLGIFRYVCAALKAVSWNVEPQKENDAKNEVTRDGERESGLRYSGGEIA